MRSAYDLSVLTSSLLLMNMEEMETFLGFFPAGTINCATRNQPCFPVNALYIISGSDKWYATTKEPLLGATDISSTSLNLVGEDLTGGVEVAKRGLRRPRCEAGTPHAAPLRFPLDSRHFRSASRRGSNGGSIEQLPSLQLDRIAALCAAAAMVFAVNWE